MRNGLVVPSHRTETGSSPVALMTALSAGAVEVVVAPARPAYYSVDRRDRFTPRDLDVARHLVHKRTNLEIATELGLATGTVARQVRRMRLRANVATRHDLATHLVARGVVAAPRSTEVRESPAGED